MISKIYDKLNYEGLLDIETKELIPEIEELIELEIKDELSYDDINIILSDIYGCLLEINHFEEAENFLNNPQIGILGTYRNILAIEPKNESIRKSSSKILLDFNHDMGNVFRFKDNSGELDEEDVDKDEKLEKLANMLFWANKLCHDLERMPKKKQKNIGDEINSQIRCLVDKLYKIKNIGIREILKARQDNEKVLVQIQKDEKGLKKITIALPQYFQPFIVHTAKDETIYKTELKLGGDEINYFSRDTIYPFKISQEKEELIGWICRNRNLRAIDKGTPQYSVQYYIWYEELQEKFNKREQKRENTNESELLMKARRLKKELKEYEERSVELDTKIRKYKEKKCILQEKIREKNSQLNDTIEKLLDTDDDLTQ